MKEKSLYIFVTFLATSLAKDDDISKLPLCPTNIEYFPQNLPMHCRMPRSADFSNSSPGLPSGAPPLPPPFYQSPPSDKQPSPVPIPIPPGGPVPYPFPGGPFPGGHFPMPMPMPIQMPGPAHKLPVIVMPFYAPDPAFKKPTRPDQQKPGHVHKRPRRPHRPRRPRPHYTETETDSGTDTDTDTESSETDTSDTSSDTSSDSSNEQRGWWNNFENSKVAPKRSGRRSNKKHSHKSKRRQKEKMGELLTPVLQYVTKDGYVIFEKKISKGEAKDWLRMRSDDADPNKENIGDAANGQEKGHNENEQLVETKDRKNDDDNAEYGDKSEEKMKETVTTERARLFKKHQKINPNSLLTPHAVKV